MPAAMCPPKDTEQEERVMTQEILRRAAGYAHRFNTLFEEYFDSLGTELDAPAFSRFTPECLRLLRELSMRGGKRMRVVVLLG